MWNLSRGRSIVGSSGVDIGDGSDPDSLASQTTRLSSVDSSSSAASESSRVGTSPVGDSDSRRRRARAGHDLIESVAVLTKTCRDWRRVLGDNHPYTSNILGCLSRAQEKLADARAAASNKSKPPP